MKIQWDDAPNGTLEPPFVAIYRPENNYIVVLATWTAFNTGYMKRFGIKPMTWHCAKVTGLDGVEDIVGLMENLQLLAEARYSNGTPAT